MAEHLTRPCNTGLNLVADEKNVVLVAKSANLPQVAVVRHDDTSLALNRLNKERSSVLSMLLKNLTNVIHVVVPDAFASGGADASNVGQIGAVVLARLGIGRHGNCSELDQGY